MKQPLGTEQIARVKAIIAKLGLVRAAAALGTTAPTLYRVRSGESLMPGTVALIEQHLKQRDAEGRTP